MVKLEKNVKIIISLFFCLVLLFIIPFITKAIPPEDYLKYYDNGDYIYISGLKDERITSVQIPEEIAGKTVTGISSNAFKDCSNIVEVKLPKTITYIGYDAFMNCINLESINLPNGLKTINSGAFYGCSNLSKITIPETVNEISDSWYYKETFGDCDPNLTLVVEKDSYAEEYAKRYGYNYEYVMYPISSAIIKIPTNKVYTGESIKPQLTIQNKTKTKVLKEGENYKLFYGKNTNAGVGTIRIDGIGNYTGTKTISFKIAQQDLSRTIVPEIDDYVYTGKDIKPTLKIIDGKRVLISGVDYSIVYKNNKDIGTAIVTVVGKGNYKGSAVRNFDILRRDISEKGTISKVTDKTYTGSKITPSVTVKYGKTKLKKNMDYTITYKNNKKIGIATIIIRGKGVYKGEIIKTFKILPKKTKIKSLKAGQAAFTLKWKKIDAITGYEIQYSTTSDFIDAGTYRYSSKKTSATFSNLDGEKNYYVRMRTYKNTNGEFYYSSWTPTRVIKTKRKEIKVGKKYKYYDDYYSKTYDYETILFKSGKKIEMNIFGVKYKGTYKQKGDVITAKVEYYGYSYSYYNITITIKDNKNLTVYYDDWNLTEKFAIL